MKGSLGFSLVEANKAMQMRSRASFVTNQNFCYSEISFVYNIRGANPKPARAKLRRIRCMSLSKLLVRFPDSPFVLRLIDAHLEQSEA